jgi:hypothetical protein
MNKIATGIFSNNKYIVNSVSRTGTALFNDRMMVPKKSEPLIKTAQTRNKMPVPNSASIPNSNVHTNNTVPVNNVMPADCNAILFPWLNFLSLDIRLFF